MKKILLTFVSAWASYCSVAQTNTFPATGNAGVGTTSPVQLFEVIGTVGAFSTTAKVNSLFAQDHTNYRGLYFGYDNSGQIGIIGASTNTTASNLAFWNYSGTNWFEAMRLTSAGYLGIGTTAPDAKLVVAGSGIVQNLTNTSDQDLKFSLTASGATDKYALIAPSTATNLAFGVAGTEKMRITNSGYLGIGTTSPGASLSFKNLDVDAGNSGITWYSPTPLAYGIYKTTGAWTGPNYQQLELQFQTGILLNPGSAYAKSYVEVNGGGLRVTSGNVGINTTNTQGYQLAVNGTAIATSMTVKLYSNWPDYVFKKDYQLPTLQEIKNYIDLNHHLPEIPSEQQIAKDGLNLGEMNKLLMKKVEELTLYLIEKDKEQHQQQEEIQELKKQVQSLMKTTNTN